MYVYTYGSASDNNGDSSNDTLYISVVVHSMSDTRLQTKPYQVSNSI